MTILGINCASCKHLKLIRGEDVENERCGVGAYKNVDKGDGEVVIGADGKPITGKKGAKNASIPGKVSLAQAWKLTTDPTGYVMSEKLDGMRAYWDGKYIQIFHQNNMK